MRTFSAIVFAAALAAAAVAAIPPKAPATASLTLATGWSQLKEGEAEGVIEQDAAHPTNKSPHLLRINESKQAAVGKGRVGAINSAAIPAEADKWYDITFNGNVIAGPGMPASIGLVFSLETSDGRVLARTTLPEIGRGAGGGGRRGAAPATAPATSAPAVAWPQYLVSLHARASDAAAHLTITPIETTNVWLDHVTLVQRASN